MIPLGRTEGGAGPSVENGKLWLDVLNRSFPLDIYVDMSTRQFASQLEFVGLVVSYGNISADLTFETTELEDI